MNTPRDPNFAARVRKSFAQQGFMTLLGAELVSVEPGVVEISLPLRPELSQQHGYAHAGAAWSIADSAAGYAAMSLMAPGDGVLTVEMKINLLAPAAGDRLRAVGRVERSGRRLTVVKADVFAEEADKSTHVATTLGTMMTMPGMEEPG